MPTELPAWAPDVADVAALMPQRFGGEVPSAQTVPTADQITRVLAGRVTEVRQRCGRVDDAAEDELEFASDTVALGAAAYIASALFPETQENAAEATFLRMRYEEHVNLLRRQVLYGHLATRPPLTVDGDSDDA